MANRKLPFSLDDQQHLLDEVKAGNQQAWEFIVREFHGPLYSFIYNMVRHPENAEELIQDVFVNFWTKREKINITTSLKAYLYRAARNHTLNFIKRRNFEINYQKRVAQEMDTSRNDTEETFNYTQLERKLTEAIEDLPDKCREIFKMSRFADMTYKEIAEAMDVPVRTVHYQIGLALKALREKLSGDYEPEALQTLLPWLMTGASGLASINEIDYFLS